MLTATTTKGQRAMLWLLPLAVTLAFFAFAASVISGARAPTLLWLLGVVVVFAAWLSYISVPRRVTLEDDELLFERPFRSASVPISDVRRIDARKWNRGFVVFSTSGGKVFMLRGTPNLTLLVAEVTKRNPTVRLVGNL